MRDAFLDELYKIAREDRRILLLTADFGAPSLDKFRKDLADQFINMGVAEQNMVNVARGLAMTGKIVYMYAILPFYLRCYEQMRHLCFQNLDVTAVGVGAGFAYDTAGPTHHALEDIAAMRALANLTVYIPSDSVMAAALAEITSKETGPKFLRLDRYALSFYEEGADFSSGYAYLRLGRDLTIIASGYMVHQALKVAGELAEKGIDAEIVDLYRIKPLNAEMVANLAPWKPLVTLEESFLNGAIGSAVCEMLSENKPKVMRIGIPDQYYFKYGGREELHRLSGLDVASITKRILEFLGG